MPKKKNQNLKSPTSWWVATVIERFEFSKEKKSNLKRKCTALSNIVILKAGNRDVAFNKAMKYGKDTVEEKNAFITEYGLDDGLWVFEGLSSLLPIYDNFNTEGTEILFDEESDVSVEKVKSWVKAKEELEAFDDSE